MGFISRFKAEFAHEMACRRDDAERAARGPDYYRNKYHHERHKRQRQEAEARYNQQLVLRNNHRELVYKEQHCYERGWHDRGLQEEADREERMYRERRKQEMEDRRRYEYGAQIYEERRAKEKRRSHGHSHGGRKSSRRDQRLIDWY